MGINLNKFYVYIYLDPRKLGKYKYGEYEFDYEPFYIGKGKGNRWKEISGRNNHFKRIINKIIKVGLEPIVIKLKESLNEKQSFILENKIISLIGRKKLKNGPLINFTDGGEGPSGYKHTEEIKKKLRKDFLDIKEFFLKNNCVLLTKEKDYKDCYTKLKYRCSKGHITKASWNNYKVSVNKCYFCNIERQKKNFFYIENEFKKRGYNLLTKKCDYKNNKQKLEYICKNGHRSSISWADFQSGQNCMKCYHRVLTENEVILIKIRLKENKTLQKDIAKLFNVHPSTVSDIKRGKIWDNTKLGE
jgi:predicted XRE-type DNA-binding protein